VEDRGGVHTWWLQLADSHVEDHQQAWRVCLTGTGTPWRPEVEVVAPGVGYRGGYPRHATKFVSCMTGYW
jgi:hypothetical protein